MFTVRNIHIAPVARPLSRFSFCSSFIAMSPAGVAAQPSPKKFAAKFAAMYCRARCPLGTEGNRKSISGVSFSARLSIMPPRSAIFSMPDQTATTPAIVNASSSALFPPVMTDRVTRSMRPRNAPVMIPPITKNPQIPFSIAVPPFHQVYVCPPLFMLCSAAFSEKRSAWKVYIAIYAALC